MTPSFPLSYATGTEPTRQAVNDFVRNSGEFDGVADFDAAIRDPLFPALMQPQYNSGDGVHPNDAGYQAMADAINLALLESNSVEAALPEAPDAILLPIAGILSLIGVVFLRRRDRGVAVPWHGNHR